MLCHIWRFAVEPFSVCEYRSSLVLYLDISVIPFSSFPQGSVPYFITAVMTHKPWSITMTGQIMDSSRSVINFGAGTIRYFSQGTSVTSPVIVSSLLPCFSILLESIPGIISFLVSSTSLDSTVGLELTVLSKRLLEFFSITKSPDSSLKFTSR